MSSIAAKRLAKELREIHMSGCPVGECEMLCIPIRAQDSRKRNPCTSLWSLCYVVVGIKLVQADDFEKWIFSIEVMGESLYKVRRISCGG